MGEPADVKIAGVVILGVDAEGKKNRTGIMVTAWRHKQPSL